MEKNTQKQKEEQINRHTMKIMGFFGVSGAVAIISASAWFGGFKTSMDNTFSNNDKRIIIIEHKLEKVEEEQREYREKVLIFMSKTDSKLDRIMEQVDSGR